MPAALATTDTHTAAQPGTGACDLPANLPDSAVPGETADSISPWSGCPHGSTNPVKPVIQPAGLAHY